jgi:hypothetical protein
VVAVTATTLTLALIVHASRVIYADSFVTPAPDERDRTCALGIRRLHTMYEQRLASAERSIELHDLDRSLQGLRVRCEAEGPAGAVAWAAIERWRYRAETQRDLTRETLEADARRALAYQSSGTLP